MAGMSALQQVHFASLLFFPSGRLGMRAMWSLHSPSQEELGRRHPGWSHFRMVRLLMVSLRFRLPFNSLFMVYYDRWQLCVNPKKTGQHK